MSGNMNLLVTAGLAVSIGFGGAIAHAQNAPAAPTPAPAATSPQMSQAQTLIQQAESQAQDAEKKAAAAVAERAQRLRELRNQQAKTPEERAALRAAREEARKKEMAEMTPEVRAAREKEIQARRAQAAALRAAKEAQAGAEASAQKAAKLKSELEAVNKPNPARGANFTPQNVAPLLQGLDGLAKRLAAIKAPADLAPAQLAQLDQYLTQLKTYMDRVDDAMEGVQRAGVQTPANKEAEALYMRAGEMATALDAEMARVEKLVPNVPQVKAMFAKFRD